MPSLGRISEEGFSQGGFGSMTYAARHPDEPARYLALSKALLQSGQPDRAQSQLEAAVWLHSGQPEAQRLLAQLIALRAVL